MAFAKFEENRFRIDGEIAENHAILVNLTASIDKNCESLLNFGLMWQQSKCAESDIYQLFLYFLSWTCMSEIKFRLYFSLNWQMRNTKLKKTQF